jgi:FMN phosphatase YigB (HAD superfamily)
MSIAVGFDFDHTLGIDNKLERVVALEMLDALARKHGVAYDRTAADEAIDATLQAYRHNEISVEAAIEGFFCRFAGFGPECLDEATLFRETVLGRAPDFVRALPGAAESLAALDAMGIPYAILTNGWSPLQEEKARIIGFDRSVFVSERIGAIKPHRKAFDVLARHFALPLEAIWFVGDDPASDSAGARELGLTAVWFDWENHVYPEDLLQPDHVIHRLEDLPVLLQGRQKEAAKPHG